MDALLLVALVSAALITAYFTYGRWVATSVFRLREDAATPAVFLCDDRDYCPTKRGVVFGHHFTSIAGTGPIVGPAIAVMWGWLPAVLWVVVGSIFIGAVHDLGSMVVSLRSRGRSIGDIAGDLLGPRVRLIFLGVLVMALWIVLAIFGLVIASVLRQFPAAIFPVLVQIPLALGIGLLIHRRGGRILIPSLVALALMYLAVFFGDAGPLHAFNAFLAAQPMWMWIIGLLAYAYVASVLPVWTLLQPRDYINALQLLTALGLLVAGLIAAGTLGGPTASAATPGAPVAGAVSAGDASAGAIEAGRQPLSIIAPMVDLNPPGAPPMIPILFITIACGAISGFHCLVASGTTSKQLTRETDARPIGYGGMLTEGFLATLVIVACVAGLGLGVTRVVDGAPTALFGADAFAAQYASWGAAGALSAKVAAFVDGAANLIASLGLPVGAGVALMGVLVASFAGTTMDTACRLQRYVIQELARTFLPPLVHKHDQDGTCLGCGRDLDGLEHGYACPGCGGLLAPRAIDAASLERQRRAASILNPFRHLATITGATLFAVVTAALLAAIPSPGDPVTLANAGKGGLILWPLFGATNQLLGGLAFLVIGAWLIAHRRPWGFIALPTLLMIALPAWALVWQTFVGDADNPAWLSDRKWLLVIVAALTIALEVWLLVEVALRLRRGVGERVLIDESADAGTRGVAT
jgi:carbon starvation protein